MPSFDLVSNVYQALPDDVRRLAQYLHGNHDQDPAERRHTATSNYV
jgi:hypothetical protein